jgi:putative FmdB family regulatory protein
MHGLRRTARGGVSRTLKLVSRLELSQRGGYFPDMPIYEFHCEDCDTDSEILVRSRDWNGTKCPRCGSLKLAK